MSKATGRQVTEETPSVLLWQRHTNTHTQTPYIENKKQTITKLEFIR